MIFNIKYNHIMFILIVFWLGSIRPSGLFSFVFALVLSILMPLFLPSSSVSVSYFILAVPMRECLGKHSCMSPPFPIAILNGTCLFPVVLQLHNFNSVQKGRNANALENLYFSKLTHYNHSEWYFLFSLCESSENWKWSSIEQILLN